VRCGAGKRRAGGQYIPLCTGAHRRPPLRGHSGAQWSSSPSPQSRTVERRTMIGEKTNLPLQGRYFRRAENHFWGPVYPPCTCPTR
jgi:hypothetical protein